MSVKASARKTKRSAASRLGLWMGARLVPATIVDRGDLNPSPRSGRVRVKLGDPQDPHSPEFNIRRDWLVALPA